MVKHGADLCTKDIRMVWKATAMIAFALPRSVVYTHLISTERATATNLYDRSMPGTYPNRPTMHHPDNEIAILIITDASRSVLHMQQHVTRVGENSNFSHLI